MVSQRTVPNRAARRLWRGRKPLFALFASAVAALGCSGSDTSNAPVGVGGSVAVAGAPGSGGSLGQPAGGNPAKGGTRAAASSGGTTPVGNGGALPTAGGTFQLEGGTSSSGGVNGVGGNTSSTGGKSMGGATAAGGKSFLDGGTAAGGKASTGGTTAVGGKASTGGTTAAGGKASTGGSTATGGATGKATFHVFLLLGQSNMAGYPKAQAADKVENARIKVLGYDACSATGRQTDQWDTAAPPLHECWNSALGPGDYFAKTLLNVIPSTDTIGLVPCAISGEKIETFMKVGGTKYAWIIARAKAAQQASGVIDGILFHQGESNSGDSTWPGKVKTLVADLRADLALGNVPFVAGELLYSGPCAGHNTLVNQLPNLITNAHVVSASGLVVDPADTQYRLHFDHDSQVEFGKRYEAKMVQALGW